jgi:hypothetical protein
MVRASTICNCLGNTLYEVRLNQNLKYGVNFPARCTVSANEIMEEVMWNSACK